MMIGTVFAALAVVGGLQGNVGIEHPADGFIEQLGETFGVVADVADGLPAKLQDGVVALGSGVLDEEQGRRDGCVGMILGHDDGVEHGLQVVVGVVFEALLTEHGVDVGQWLEAVGTGLVVDDADVVASIGIGHHVHAVDAAAKEKTRSLPLLHIFLQREDGEGRKLAVEEEQLAQVVDDDLTVDEGKAV